jgi:hypothetical protein
MINTGVFPIFRSVNGDCTGNFITSLDLENKPFQLAAGNRLKSDEVRPENFGFAQEEENSLVHLIYGKSRDARTTRPTLPREIMGSVIKEDRKVYLSRFRQPFQSDELAAQIPFDGTVLSSLWEFYLDKHVVLDRSGALQVRRWDDLEEYPILGVAKYIASASAGKSSADADK